ncbi:hypothetical protein DB88DRAFT_240757 [Papiliotrema laurentii]|uniref:Extracellular membrane protein CFEM domain-containing protein n=1 Tax=Papiliotrema laurentii TaxID=5418 RepID=A0AAD9FRL9_PAPLA|nr:hypothetical protein DB88DRAFT_240757 [Papiliotrema laurentii]
MYKRSLALLFVLSLASTSSARQFRHVYRQDPASTDGSAASTDTGTDPSAAVSADPSVAASPAPSADPAADTSAAPSPAASSSTGTSGNSGVLAGAGSGGAVPSSCSSCDNTYTLVNGCSSEGSSESCSPICTNWSAAISCLNCLLQNGQQNLDQSAVQQVVWNLESSCSSLGFSVSSATISATATTTGPFDTPSASITPTPTSSNNASTSKHSGLTAYNTTTRTPVSATLSAVVNPSQTGAAGKRGRVDKGVVLAGAGIVGAMMLEL